jgi:hypothetical protein
MSEANERQEPTRGRGYQFSYQEIEKFFNAMWRLQECEVCGKPDTWTYMLPRPLALIPVSDGSTHAIGRPLMTALRVFCNNCGNTKFLAAHVIRQWLDHHP